MIMRRFIYFPALVAICFLATCCKPAQPHADHVILLGFDAMSALGIQRAETPNMNHMIENGAVSVHTRCVRETASSQNWMSMVSASPIELHGVFNNGWKPGDSDNLPPALENGIGLYPTIFDHIRSQKPQLRQHTFIEWAGETRMYDMSAFDKAVICGVTEGVKDYKDVIEGAFADYLENRPEFMFLSMDITDHMGHLKGHESDGYFDCVHEMDGYIGDFVKELEARGWMKNTVIIITADHGGLGPVHGGDTMAEFETPILIYGKGVTKGQVMKHVNMIYDVGATVAALLGVELPVECRGKFLAEAFGPRNEGEYVPVPMVRPYAGKADGEVSISCDKEGAEIHYTIDGTEPTADSPKYEKPFKLDASAEVRAVAFKGGSKSIETRNYLYTGVQEPPVSYKLYRNVTSADMPDFTKFGRPDESGYVDTFGFDDLKKLEDETYFAVLFSSNLNISKAGTYWFSLEANHGALMFIDGELFIDCRNGYNIPPIEKSIELSEGKHFIRIEYRRTDRRLQLDLFWKGAAGKYTPIIPDVLDR